MRILNKFINRITRHCEIYQWTRSIRIKMLQSTAAHSMTLDRLGFFVCVCVAFAHIHTHPNTAFYFNFAEICVYFSASVAIADDYHFWLVTVQRQTTRKYGRRLSVSFYGALTPVPIHRQSTHHFSLLCVLCRVVSDICHSLSLSLSLSVATPSLSIYFYSFNL